jgi:hypothetical protein
MPRSKMVELYLHSTIHLHGGVLKCLSAGTTLPFFNPLLDRIGIIITKKLMKAKNIKVIVFRDVKPCTLSSKQYDVTPQTIIIFIMT